MLGEKTIFFILTWILTLPFHPWPLLPPNLVNSDPFTPDRLPSPTWNTRTRMELVDDLHPGPPAGQVTHILPQTAEDKRALKEKLLRRHYPTPHPSARDCKSDTKLASADAPLHPSSLVVIALAAPMAPHPERTDGPDPPYSDVHLRPKHRVHASALAAVPDRASRTVKLYDGDRRSESVQSRMKLCAIPSSAV